MATGAIGELVLKFTADIADILTKTEQVEKRLTTLSSEATRSINAIKESFKQIFQAGVVAGAVTGLEQLVTSTIHAEAEIGRLADKIGVSVEQLSSMRFAAAEGGLSLEQVSTVAARLSKALFEAQDGSTKAASALELLNLDAKTLVGLPVAESLKLVAQALAETQDGTAKTAVEMELLAKSGKEAGAFLKALATNGVEAAQITTEMATAAREAEANIRRFNDASETFRITLVNELLPALNLFLLNIIAIQKAQGPDKFFAAVKAGVSDLVEVGGRLTGVTGFLGGLAEGYAKLSGVVIISKEDLGNWGGEASRAAGKLRDLGEAIKNAAADLAKLNALVDQIEGKDFGIGSAFSAQFKILTDALNKGLLSLERYRELTKELLAQQPFATKQAEEAKKLADEQKKLEDSIVSYRDKLLDAINVVGKSTLAQELYKAMLALTGKEGEYLVRVLDADNQRLAYQKILLDQETAGWQQYEAAMKALETTAQQYLDNLDKQNAGLQDQINTFGLSSTAAEIYRTKLELTKAALERNAEAVEKLNLKLKLLNELQGKEEFAKAASEAEKAWQHTATTIANSLDQAFESVFTHQKTVAQAFRKFLQDLFNTLVLKPIIQFATQNIANLLTGILGGNAPGGGGLGSLGNLFPGSSLFNSFATSSAGSALGLSVPAVDVLGDASFVAANSITAFGSAVGAAIPYIGLAIAAYEILTNTILKHEPSPVEGTFGIRPAGTSSGTFEDQASVTTKFGHLVLGFLDEGTKQFGGGASLVFDKVIADSIDAFATRFSPAQSAHFAEVLKNMTFQAFSGTFSTEDFLQKYGGQILQQVIAAAFNELDPALGAVAAKFSGTADEVAKFSNTLLSIYDGLHSLNKLDLPTVIGGGHGGHSTATGPDQGQLEAAQAKFDTFVQNVYKALDDATQATADKVQAFVAIVVAAANSTDVGFNAMAAKLEGLSSSDIPAFIDALGGASAALNSINYLYQNFTTSATKHTDAITRLNNGFTQLGLAVPTTHAQFLALLNSFDLTTEAGRKLYAAVLAMAPAFVEVYGTADNATTAVTDAASAVDTLTAAAHNLTGTALTSAQDFFNQHFTTPEEQHTARIAADQAKLNTEMDTFGDKVHDLGYSAIPTTVQGFHDFVLAAIAAYGADSDFVHSLLILAPTILDLSNDATTAAANFVAAAQAISDASGVDLSSIDSVAKKFVDNFLKKIDAINQQNPGDFGAKTGLKLGLVGDEIATLQDKLATYLGTTGGNVDATAQTIQREIALLSSTNAKLSAQLAQFTVLKAAYGSAIAEQLVNLQDWYDTTKKLLGNNADALSALQTIFDAQWKSIIDGTSTGVTGTADALQKLIDNIKAFIKSLTISDLSPLTPLQKLSEAQKQYNDELAKAQAGDQIALGDITKFAQAYLQQSRAVYASSQAYTDIFNSVLAGLTGLTDVGSIIDFGFGAGAATTPTVLPPGFGAVGGDTGAGKGSGYLGPPTTNAVSALNNALPLTGRLTSSDDTTALGLKIDRLGMDMVDVKDAVIALAGVHEDQGAKQRAAVDRNAQAIVAGVTGKRK